MKHTYGNQTIDLFDKKQPEQILLSLSGGLDSAALLYLLLKYNYVIFLKSSLPVNIH